MIDMVKFYRRRATIWVVPTMIGFGLWGALMANGNHWAGFLAAIISAHCLIRYGEMRELRGMEKGRLTYGPKPDNWDHWFGIENDNVEADDA